MTLGGMALAVGILVDDATVDIENISTNLEQGKPLEQAILDGSQQIAVPAFVSTICICIVFVPLFFLTGVARYLFVPLGEAVVFAMLASYVLSRTLVPTMANYLLKGHEAEAQGHQSAASRNPLVRLQAGFEAAVQRIARGLPPVARGRRRAARLVRAGDRRLLRGIAGAGAVGRRRLLPVGGQRAIPPSPACAHGHPYRRNGRPVRPGRGVDSERRPGAAPRHDHRQHRRALQRHQPHVQHVGADRPRRRGPAREPHGRPSPDRGIRPRSAPAAGPQLPGSDVRISAGRHRHADPELRPAGADRRADRRQQPREQPEGRCGPARPHRRSFPAWWTCTFTSPTISPSCTSPSTAPARQTLA